MTDVDVEKVSGIAQAIQDHLAAIILAIILLVPTMYMVIAGIPVPEWLVGFDGMAVMFFLKK